MRICVIFNPTAKGDKARRFRRHLDRIGQEATLKLTDGPNHARDLAAEAVREGFGLIVAAGGDGTLNEVLNGIADEPDGCERTRLGVLPLGTVNVFARELAIPLRFAAGWETIQGGRERWIDLGCVEFSGASGGGRRYFSQLAGAGLDARAVELVDWGTKKKVGYLAYVLAGLRALRQPPAKITVTTDDFETTGQSVVLGNGQLYGGNFRVFPDADLGDGLLDVCVFPRFGWATLFWCTPRVLTRRTLPPRAVRRLQAPAVTLSSTAAVPVQVDGELVGHLPATFSVARQSLRVIVP